MIRNSKYKGVWHHSISNRGIIAWLLALVLTVFYVALYFFPQYLGLGQEGQNNSGLIALFDSLSLKMKGIPANQWFVYGVLYTLAILIMGIRFLYKYKGNRYQQLRTGSLMFFQLGFAFLIPEILDGLNGGQKWYDRDLKNMWPLDYDFFHQWHLQNMLSNGHLGLFFLIFGILLFLFISPVLTYFYGKRWYCSWVCGCGGLAETAGDPFRHLSNKSLNVWRLERYLIYSILIWVVVMTIAVIMDILREKPDAYWITEEVFVLIICTLIVLLSLLLWRNKAFRQETDRQIQYLVFGAGIIIMSLTLLNLYFNTSNLFFISSEQLKSWYGFYIGAIFSGVIGVGFYPLLGSRIWCRFACPMAAILGLQQKFFSRFRISSNGQQCISCGNCSAFCEMGIDVRWYAQRGEDITRASCVGCGICANVCPRGVLKLENSLQSAVGSRQSSSTQVVMSDF